MKTKEELKGTAIESVNAGDGKKIIHFYENHGIINRNHLTGDSCTTNSGDKIFYGEYQGQIICRRHWQEDKVLPISVIDEEFFNDDDKIWYKIQELMEDYHKAKLKELIPSDKEIIIEARIVEDYKYDDNEHLSFEKAGRFNGFLNGVNWLKQKLQSC